MVYSWDSSYGINSQNTKQLVMLIEFILKNNNKNKINLIGHSQGGNFAKDVMVKLYDRKIDMKNIRLISLATPHKGIKEMNSKSMILLPSAEIMYDIFSLNLNTRDQVIQASKRLYNGAYKQLYACKKNKYLQKLNKNFISRGLYKNAVLIAGKNDKIICEKSSLFEGVLTIKKLVNNSHGNIVISPDNEIFKIIAELK
ncbi:MAG: alpha/beta hydrolase [Sulfurimonas sp.]|nr:alpha/beta hydrolase [Sulfurimonas sp.]